MTDRELFRFGFLARCAEECLSPEQTRERIKSANWLSTLLGGGGAALGIGLPAVGLAGSAAIGAGAGHLAAKATEPQMDVEDAKLQELIAAYRQQAEQARRNAARVSYRMSTLRPRGRVPRLPAAA